MWRNSDAAGGKGIWSITICLSIVKWDHIQGLPFFIPAHRYHPVETAKLLWYQILNHKKSIESKLKKGSGITVSVGCAMCPKDGKSANILVKKADKALYFSKVNGKNQVTAYYDIN